MNWEQTVQALQALAEVSLRMRKPGDWYVNARIEVKSGSMLVGGAGTGRTPEQAVLAEWNRLVTDLKDGEYLVINAGNEERRAVRWNGFMWQDIKEASCAR